MPPTKKVPLNMRIDPALKVAAEEVAKRENRTLTNLVETMLIERCRHHGVPVGGASSAVPMPKAMDVCGDE